MNILTGLPPPPDPSLNNTAPTLLTGFGTGVKLTRLVSQGQYRVDNRSAPYTPLTRKPPSLPHFKSDDCFRAILNLDDNGNRRERRPPSLPVSGLAGLADW